MKQDKNKERTRSEIMLEQDLERAGPIRCWQPVAATQGHPRRGRRRLLREGQPAPSGCASLPLSMEPRLEHGMRRLQVSARGY